MIMIFDSIFPILFIVGSLMNPSIALLRDEWRSTLARSFFVLRQLANLRTASDRACQSCVCDLLHYAAWSKTWTTDGRNLAPPWMYKTLQIVGQNKIHT